MIGIAGPHFKANLHAIICDGPLKLANNITWHRALDHLFFPSPHCRSSPIDLDI